MLTRLKVDGFKNLDDVDVRFGPFTCIAGPNGVGKSNLFDAIAFLAALADKPLAEAALAIRGGEAWRGEVRSLFRRTGEEVADRMRFEAEMIIPEVGEDALGQEARASMTFLHYTLELRYRLDPTTRTLGSLEIAHESMVHINRSQAKARLGFRHKKAWRDTVVKGRRTSPYISTSPEGGRTVISLHADSEGGLGGGRPRKIPAASLPRTVLSSVNNAAEHRTLVLAQAEMRGWTQLQLEPSALRAPDGFSSLLPGGNMIGANGSHLPATLYDLARRAERSRSRERDRRIEAGEPPDGPGLPDAPEDLYARIANRLSELVENVRSVDVDVDDKRQLLSAVLTDRFGTRHVASALSDGTLRFLALTVMETDPRNRGLLCLEEPENGIHPQRIGVMIALLADLAVDAYLPVDDENPLRQVIVNTHSPSVVACVPDDALLVALGPGRWRWEGLTLRWLPGTWRHRLAPNCAPLARGDLLAYLNPLGVPEVRQTRNQGSEPIRVKDREDLQTLLPFLAADSGSVP